MERLERQQTQLELDALWDAKPVKVIIGKNIPTALEPISGLH